MKNKPGRPTATPFKLRPHDRGKLKKILSEKARHDARAYERAQILLKLSEGYGLTETAKLLGINFSTVRRRRDLYVSKDLESALHDGARSGQPRKLDAAQEQRIVAIACTEPPEGHGHWTQRLLAEEATKRGIVDSLSYHAVRILLQRHELKPWREKNVVRRKVGR